MTTELDQQLAAISVVKSSELMDTVNDSRELNNLSNQVLGAANRVQQIKELLENSPDHTLEVDDVIALDDELSQLNVITVEDGGITNAARVDGAEHFGRSLRPSQYRLTRIAACENFLSDTLETAKSFTKRLVENFHDAYTLSVEDTESLIKRFKMIERACKDMGEFKDGLESFNLSPRLFNLLKVQGEVKEDWQNQITNLFKTTSALSSNYYDYSEKELTQIMAFFSRFEGVNDDQEARQILLTCGALLNQPAFRECKIDISDKNVPWLRQLRSVELMGGRYLIDTRWTKPLKVDSVDAIDNWFDSRVRDLGVRFNKRDSINFVNVEQEIKTFGSATIQHICQTSIKILENWLVICNKAVKHRISERDYEIIGNNLTKMDISASDKHRILAMYSMIVRKNQQDLLNLNADFTRYLVITLNAIASLCNDSINFAKSVS